MQHKFQASLSQVVLKKIFEYFSMYFYGLNLGPPCLGPPSLKIEHRVDHYSSRCMHDPGFMALALIVSEKMT